MDRGQPVADDEKQLANAKALIGGQADHPGSSSASNMPPLWEHRKNWAAGFCFVGFGKGLKALPEAWGLRCVVALSRHRTIRRGAAMAVQNPGAVICAFLQGTLGVRIADIPRAGCQTRQNCRAAGTVHPTSALS